MNDTSHDDTNANQGHDFAKMLSKLSDEELVQLFDDLGKVLSDQRQQRQRGGQKQLANMTQSLVHGLGLLKKRLEQMKIFRGPISKPSVLRGFHGTTLFAANEIMQKIANGHPNPFKESSNHWDWLGNGVYFWLEAPHRAADRAYWWYMILRRQLPWLPNLFDLGQYPPPQGHRSHFAVIEARIRLFPETSMNLLDITWMEILKGFTREFEARAETKLEPVRTLAMSNYNVIKKLEVVETDKGMLQQVVRSAEEKESGPMRTRDCQLFNDFINDFPDIQCIVAGFREGEQVIPGVNVWDKDHVQINVVDQSIIDLGSVTVHDAAKFLSAEQISKYTR